MNRHDDAIEKAALTGYTKLYTETAWRNETHPLREAYRNGFRDQLAAYESVMRPEVTTMEQLDALPAGVTVICAAGWPWLHETDEEGAWWWERPGHEEGFTCDEVPLPARVIHWGRDPNTPKDTP